MLRIASIIAACFLVLMLVIPTSGQSGIIVDNADGLRTLDFVPSTSLNNLMTGVQARVDVVYANSVRNFALVNVPAPLEVLLNGMTQRVVTQYSNRTRHMPLGAPPNGLQTFLNLVPARVAFQYANANRQASLTYPRQLINDTIAPVSSGVQLIVEPNVARLTWITNEFARCALHYGTRQGEYTETEENLLYEKQHSVLLPSFEVGTIYYGQVTCVDQSDNTSTSSEFTFGQEKTPTSTLSLPLLHK